MDLKRKFSLRRYKRPKKHKKWRWTLSATRKAQIKTMKLHFIPIKMSTSYYQDNYYQDNKKTTTVRMWRTNLFTAGRNVKWGCLFGSSANDETPSYHTPKYPSWVCNQEKWEHRFTQKHVHERSQQHYS